MPSAQNPPSRRWLEVRLNAMERAWTNAPMTPTEEAVFRHRSVDQDVAKLLTEGLRPDTLDDRGWPLLHNAADLGLSYVVAALVRAGAPIDKTDGSGATVLDRCWDLNRRSTLLFMERWEVLRQVLLAGASVTPDQLIEVLDRDLDTLRSGGLPMRLVVQEGLMALLAKPHHASSWSACATDGRRPVDVLAERWDSTGAPEGSLRWGHSAEVILARAAHAQLEQALPVPSLRAVAPRL